MTEYLQIKNILKKIILLFILGLTTQTAFGQNYLKRSTIALSANSEEIISSKHYIIQQSIGQSSMIGLAKSNSYELRQGFIHPELVFLIHNNSINKEELSVNVFPNPTKGDINITFSELIIGKARLEVFDQKGKKIFSTLFYSDTNLDEIFPDLNSGIYLLKITANNKSTVKQVTKI